MRTPKIIIAAKTMSITEFKPATPELYVGVVMVATVVFKPGSRFTPIYTNIAATINPKIIFI